MHYAWHPACGTDVEVQYREVRRGERVLICRVAEDTSAVVPAWVAGKGIASEEPGTARGLPRRGP